MTSASNIAALSLPDEAEAETERLSVDERSALSVLGHVMLEHERLSDALAVFELLAEVAPEEGYARRMLVYVHLRSGEYERALDAVEDYRRREYDDELALVVVTFLEAKALWGAGREAEARERLRAYREMAATL